MVSYAPLHLAGSGWPWRCFRHGWIAVLPVVSLAVIPPSISSFFPCSSLGGCLAGVEAKLVGFMRIDATPASRPQGHAWPTYSARPGARHAVCARPGVWQRLADGCCGSQPADGAHPSLQISSAQAANAMDWSVARRSGYYANLPAHARRSAITSQYPAKRPFGDAGLGRQG